ncbi:MAG: translation initiation factor IF-2 [Bacteroidetes bacterium HGW-Bacteroidetes-15]|nr:MAG: translation initiation factor IF-2 [Bacteroidetes bacterium HGW-Bacteroidetes-15]
MTNAEKAIRLSKLAREFNVGISTLVDFLGRKGHKIESNPNTKVDATLYDILAKEYGAEINLKQESKKVSLINLREKKESVSIDDIETSQSDDEENESTDEEVIVKNVAPEKDTFKTEKPQINITVKGKIDLETKGEKKSEQAEKPTLTKKVDQKEEVAAEEPVQPKAKDTKPKIEHIETETQKIHAPKIVGKVDLDAGKKPKSSIKKADKEATSQKPSVTEPKKTHTTESKKEVVPEKTEKKPQLPQEQEIPVKEKAKPEQEKFYRSEVEKLTGPTVVGKIDLTTVEPKKKIVTASGAENGKIKKKRRKRIRKDNQKVSVSSDAPSTGTQTPKPASAGSAQLSKRKKKKQLRQEVNEEEVQKQIKETLARLTSKGGKSKGSKYRREKRDLVSARHLKEMEQEEVDKQTIKVTEFVSVSELANMMDVPSTEVIEVCMNLGLMVSINQRLDAETMAMVADEFGFKVEFVSVELQESIKTDDDKPEDLLPRSPIVTVMGHVDHGKTSLLDFVRSANVIAGEAGGITQHIGAYSVELESGRQITFLDTPGHEAFTAMRARGAKITDVAIIVVAADDNVMPQTVEAINHASAAGVPIVFAINKIDKPNANPEKIKESLANMNYLVEDWGGKYQSQDVSAKSGLNVDKLLEKVLLEAELLDLKANPNKKGVGTIVESSLDKGRGYTATVLVQAGSLRQGDIMLAGTFFGHVKAMFNERGKRITVAGPSSPVQVIGLNGAPLAGDYFNIMDSDKEAKEIANKREQLQRMQGLRAHKHITLDEIGRRIAIGNFQELNIVLKGDVDGSIEALSDALIKLSTEQIQVNIIHKAVGQISESDILLAAASNAIVIGFQVRPSVSARKLAEKEQIDIRMYSIIYDAINEVKAAMEGMLSPEIKEEILGTAEVLEAFKITKVGTVAGCIVREGKILRNAKCRLIRDGIVVYTGDLGSLKRFKDDAKEVANGFECGLNINNFNDIKVGDIVESFQEVEVKRKL